MKPLILDFKETRVEIDSIPNYEYDKAKSINIVKINGESKPFIDLELNDLELLTETKVQRERDDNHFLSELLTKTEVKRERDDSPDMFLELVTKTFTNRERDDQNTSNYK